MDLFSFMPFGVLVSTFACPQTCTEYSEKGLMHNMGFIKKMLGFGGFVGKKKNPVHDCCNT